MKNKRFILTGVLLSIFLSMFLFYACEEDKSIINEEIDTSQKQEKKAVFVEDGILHMSEDTARKFASYLADMSDSEFREWEKEMGFLSLRTVANNVHNELKRAKSKEEYHSIIEENNDIFSIEDSTLVLKIDDAQYRSVINREGVYVVGKNMIKVTPQYLYFSQKEDLRNIDQRLKSTNSNVKAVKWRFGSSLKSSVAPGMSRQNVPYSTLKLAVEPSSPTCGSGLSSGFADRQRSDGKRKVKVWMSLRLDTWDDEDDIEQKYYVRIAVRGYKKIFGVYDWYETTLSFEDAAVKVSAPYVTDELVPQYDESKYYWKTYSRNNWSKTKYNAELLSDKWYIGNTEVINCDEELPDVHSFCKFRVKATSRGIGDRWAKICEGYSCCDNF